MDTNMKSTCKFIVYPLLESTLKEDTTFYQNRHFLRQKMTEIRVWCNLDKRIVMTESPIFFVMIDDDDRSLHKNFISN